MRAIRWMALAAAVTLAACGGDGDGGTGPGNGGGASSFSAKVSGDIEVPSVKGVALFGTVVDEEQGPLFGLEMAEGGEGESLIQIVRLGGQVPTPGTYQISDAINGNPQNGDFMALAFDSDNGEPVAIFLGTGGTLKVTSASDRAFKGTFSFNAEGGLFEDPETTLQIKIEGSFNATPATTGIQLRAARSR